VPRLEGRILAVKQSITLRPTADVWFLSGERTDELCRPYYKLFAGTHIIARGKSHPNFPAGTKRVGRSKHHWELSDLPTHVTGRDAGTSAINIAYLFGATEIILLGYDFTGARWFTPAEIRHPMPVPPEAHHRRHMEFGPQLAEDAKRKGIRIVNCSPISRATWFERRRLEEFV